ncbi:CBS domain-containing protein [Amorphus orientalis]|uniref:CBS domain-containing protein n=1 Tax=Amorphus orientalis TaxID=649198 RepID=A0AAE4AT37_9HYPH|nr:CBS domain-containing protein [Amorphus orientalis]MDQ0315747.1 CBS domain-containing protein [Amorphus orientalis]
MTVATILSDKGRDIVTARETASITEICETLAERKIGAIIVTDDAGSIVGILSERDIVRSCAAHGAEALHKTVAELMTRSVITVSPDDNIATVMERMTSGRFRHMPVVQGDKLVGVISIGDVVKHRIAEAEREAEEMRSYIATA